MMIKNFLSVTEHILNRSVHDTVSEEVGKIKDIFIDPDSNRPVFIVVSAGGFLGIGSDHIVLPWHILEFNPNTHNIKLTRDRHELKNAPDLDVGKLKNADPGEIDKMTRYYGEADFRKGKDTNEADKQFQEPDDHHHQEYEGSAKITGEEPKNKSEQPPENIDYKKMKGDNT